MGSARKGGWKQLTWWGLVFGGLCWVAAVISYGLEAISHDAVEDSVPKLMGGVIGGLVALLVFYLVALLAGLVAGRKRNVVSGVFVVLALMAVGGQVLMRLSDGAKVENASAKSERSEPVVGQDDAELDITAITAEVSRRIQTRLGEAVQSYRAAAQSLTGAHPLAPSWVAEKEQLIEAKARVQAFREANAEFAAASDFSFERVRQEFEKLGVSDPEPAREYATGAAGNPALEVWGPKLRSIDARIADLSDEACDFLLAHWDEWGYTPEGQMQFTSHESLDGWSAIADRNTALVQEKQQVGEGMAAEKASGHQEGAARDEAEGEGG